MQIISHRGCWEANCEKNSELAFRKSFELGFGTETDLRDLNGELIISHDMPIIGPDILSLNDFLEIYSDYEPLPLALNIKADGLQQLICESLKKYDIKNYVLFDMSLPDQIVTCKYNLRHLTRASEYETAILLDSAEGVWSDEFNESWIDLKFICDLSQKNKAIYIVSPELLMVKHLL